MNQIIVDGDRCLNMEDDRFEAKSALGRDIWESYSAFANAHGGTIVIGLSEREDGDGFDITGVKDAESRRDEIWSVLNNRKKVSVNVMSAGDIEIVDANGKQLIVMTVPPADRLLRPVYIDSVENGTFKRNGSGDFHCTPAEIGSMYRDASAESRDVQPSKWATLEDLDNESVESYRNMMSASLPGNSWLKEPRSEFLRLIGAARKIGDDIVPTMAGLMMFGQYSTIALEVPGFMLDYKEYEGNDPEWTRRYAAGTPGWSGNLFDFYTRVATRLPLLVDTGFRVPDGMTRVDDTDLVRILREAMTNAVSNADYWGHGGVVIEIHPDRATFSNPGTFRIPVEMAKDGGHSDPRNPTILRMLSFVGKSERAGTGVRNIIGTCRENGLPDPDFREVVRPETVMVTVPLTKTSPMVMNLSDRIAELISKDNRITATEIATELGVSRNAVTSEIAVLKRNGKLERIGGPRGRWQLNRRWV